MKAQVGTFKKEEKAIVGAFSVMVKLREGSLPALTAGPRQRRGCPPGPGRPLGAAAHPAAGLSMLPQSREKAVKMRKIWSNS